MAINDGTAIPGSRQIFWLDQSRRAGNGCPAASLSLPESGYRDRVTANVACRATGRLSRKCTTRQRVLARHRRGNRPENGIACFTNGDWSRVATRSPLTPILAACYWIIALFQGTLPRRVTVRHPPVHCPILIRRPIDLPRWSLALVGGALMFAQLGCRSRAHRDVYHAKMANEIRVLEDQLYEADYQNQILREKLQRSKHHSFQSTIDEQYPPAEPAPAADSDLPDDFNIDDWDMGADLGDPIIDNDAFAPREGAVVPPVSPGDDGVEMLPPPGGPEPPGAKDLEIGPIVPGEILPPPTTEGEEMDAPPGKVDLPDALDANAQPLSIPERLELHSGLSGGHRFDDEQETDGLFLVINVVDQRGHMIDLSQFDIDADMSVVALDPTLEADEAKIARWDFTAQEVSEFIRTAPVYGFHIPVKWQAARPSGDQVIVHVRLKTEDEEMRCEGRLSVSRPATIADWTPRGEKARR